MPELPSSAMEVYSEVPLTKTRSALKRLGRQAILAHAPASTVARPDGVSEPTLPASGQDRATPMDNVTVSQAEGHGERVSSRSSACRAKHDSTVRRRPR